MNQKVLSQFSNVMKEDHKSELKGSRTANTNTSPSGTSCLDGKSKSFYKKVACFVTVQVTSKIQFPLTQFYSQSKTKVITSSRIHSSYTKIHGTYRYNCDFLNGKLLFILIQSLRKSSDHKGCLVCMQSVLKGVRISKRRHVSRHFYNMYNQYLQIVSKH